jgi:hypothetical protein
MKPTWTLRGLVSLVAVLLIGCSTQQPPVAPAHRKAPVVATADSGGLTIRLTLPAATLPAGSSVVATVVADNESQNSEVYDNSHIRILDASGTVLFDSASVESTRTRGQTADRLPAGATATHVFTFVVPPAGTYAAEASMNATKRKAVAQFVSSSAN